jgi:hypothetical protein
MKVDYLVELLADLKVVHLVAERDDQMAASKADQRAAWTAV